MSFRPSSAHRWVGGGCTGSIASMAAMPRPPDTRAASEGTRLHDLAASMLLGRYNRTACDQADWEIIGPYVEHVEALHQKYRGTLHVEETLRHPVFGSGTPDAVIRAPQRLIIIDLKTGWRPVEAIRNWQLLMYACMLEPPQGTTVELCIVQQPPYHPDGPIRTWTVEPDLVLFDTLIRKAISEINEAPKLVATPSNCLYCSAVTNCDAARNASLGGMDMALSRTGPLPAEALRTELITMRNVVKLSQQRLVALEAEAEARMRGGEMVPGCAMQTGRRGAREWDADADKVRAVCAMVGQDAAAPQALQTPAQMIKAGVPEALVDSVTKRKPSKMSITTDAIEKTRKLFS